MDYTIEEIEFSRTHQQTIKKFLDSSPWKKIQIINQPLDDSSATSSGELENIPRIQKIIFLKTLLLDQKGVLFYPKPLYTFFREKSLLTSAYSYPKTKRPENKDPTLKDPVLLEGPDLGAFWNSENLSLSSFKLHLLAALSFAYANSVPFPTSETSQREMNRAPLNAEISTQGFMQRRDQSLFLSLAFAREALLVFWESQEDILSLQKETKASKPLSALKSFRVLSKFDVESGQGFLDSLSAVLSDVYFKRALRVDIQRDKEACGDCEGLREISARALCSLDFTELFVVLLESVLTTASEYVYVSRALEEKNSRYSLGRPGAALGSSKPAIKVWRVGPEKKMERAYLGGAEEHSTLGLGKEVFFRSQAELKNLASFKSGDVVNAPRESIEEAISREHDQALAKGVPHCSCDGDLPVNIDRKKEKEWYDSISTPEESGGARMGDFRPEEARWAEERKRSIEKDDFGEEVVKGAGRHR